MSDTRLDALLDAAVTAYDAIWQSITSEDAILSGLDSQGEAALKQLRSALAAHAIVPCGACGYAYRDTELTRAKLSGPGASAPEGRVCEECLVAGGLLGDDPIFITAFCRNKGCEDDGSVIVHGPHGISAYCQHHAGMYAQIMGHMGASAMRVPR